MYSNTGDGLKNYFTLQSYITQPPESGYFKYDAMHYPFGDYIWYTDNSPLLSLILRFVHVNIYPVNNALPIMHAVMLLNVLLAPIFVRKLLKRLLSNQLLIIAGTFLLVWTSPQFFRLFVGHYNLSLSIFYFIAINWTLSWYDALKSNKQNIPYQLIIGLFCLLFFSATIHLYYLLLLGIPLGLFIAIATFAHIKQFNFNWRKIVFPIITMLVVAATVFSIIHVTDGYFNLRVAEPDGKSYAAWEARFFHFYKAKEDINSLPFLGGYRTFEPENAPYLGSFFWYIGSIILIVFIIDKVKSRKWYKPKLSTRAVICGLTVLFTFFSALGPKLGFLGMDNIFSPLYYIGKVYPSITHFRCLGRISWWCFYLAQIGMLWLLEKYILSRFKKLFVYLIIIGFVLIAVDINDYRKFHQTRVNENVFSSEKLAALPNLKYSEFQAILPIPYYSVGSERYAYTIDDDVYWSMFTYQLQLKSKLPLMSVRLSRIPPIYAEDMFSIFLADTLSDALKNTLNNKPILVVYNSKIKEFSNLEPAASVIKEGPDIIEKFKMEKLYSVGTVTYYKWYVN